MFEEMMSGNKKVNFEAQEGEMLMQPVKEKSLWHLFLDAIQRYPRLEKLKDII